MKKEPETFEQAFKQTERVLAFGAHADDIDVTSGGAVALLTNAGKEVVYCVITDGSKGSRETNTMGDALKERREAEQRSAAETLGVTDIRFLGLVDGELENTKDARREIVRVIREVKPDTVLSWDPACPRFDNWARHHPDHRAAGALVYDSIYPASGNAAYFPELIDEGLKPHNISSAWFFGTRHPNLTVNIAETIKEKVKAIHKHESQIPHLDKVERFINEYARKAGQEQGIEFAEVFRYLAMQ